MSSFLYFVRFFFPAFRRCLYMLVSGFYHGDLRISANEGHRAIYVGRKGYDNQAFNFGMDNAGKNGCHDSFSIWFQLGRGQGYMEGWGFHFYVPLPITWLFKYQTGINYPILRKPLNWLYHQQQMLVWRTSPYNSFWRGTIYKGTRIAGLCRTRYARAWDD